MAFKKASKMQQKARILLEGPAGSGKTESALRIATGLIEGQSEVDDDFKESISKRTAAGMSAIAMIDTERGSGELYSDRYEYDHDELRPPYSPERYIEKINEAAKMGYPVLIIDSASHGWIGQGGVVEMANKFGAGSRNPYGGWDKATPEQDKFVSAMLDYPGHILVTLRTKTAYEIVENEKGKKAPVKVGLAPVQRDGLDYEFTVVFDISIYDHLASSSKDRTRLFTDKQPEMITEETGKQIVGWLLAGKPESEIVDELFNDAVTSASTAKELNEWYVRMTPKINQLGSRAKNQLIEMLKQRKETLTQSIDKPAGNEAAA
jgi:hypothetical protein